MTTETETETENQTQTRSDLDLARRVRNQLWWTGYWRRNEILVSVEQGWVTLSGAIDWQYQRRTAFEVLRDLPDVAGFVDRLTINFDQEPVTTSPTDATVDAVTFSRWS